MARLNYTYDNKYLLTATFRADGSSKFGKNNKWGISFRSYQLESSRREVYKETKYI